MDRARRETMLQRCQGKTVQRIEEQVFGPFEEREYTVFFTDGTWLKFYAAESVSVETEDMLQEDEDN